jgi:hypothetical protein
MGNVGVAWLCIQTRGVHIEVYCDGYWLLADLEGWVKRIEGSFAHHRYDRIDRLNQNYALQDWCC